MKIAGALIGFLGIALVAIGFLGMLAVFTFDVFSGGLIHAHEAFKFLAIMIWGLPAILLGKALSP